MPKGVVCVGCIPEVDPVIVELVVLSEKLDKCLDRYYSPDG